MKNLLLTLALSLPLIALADQPVQKGERIDDARIVNQQPVPAAFQAAVEDAAGEDVVTVLEPVFQELEDRYQRQIDQIAAQINLAQPDQQEALEMQAVALKQQLHEERLQAVLTYVRANGNREAEERVLAVIENYYNKKPMQTVPVHRDPVTGAELEGESR
ncbi:hypothetical protein HUU59_07760 [bacterium]|nr:hypothetical protein [bacterium]